MKAAAATLCCLVLVLGAIVREGACSKPNVLFVVVDDLRPQLGCYGEDYMVTPNIDQLASKSVLFERAYVQFAVCSPSRTSFLTSRRPDTTHIFDLLTYFRNFTANFTTLPQHFKDNGYATQSVGKIFHPGIASNNTDDYPYSWSFPAWHGSTEKYMYKRCCPGSDGQLHKNAVCPVYNMSLVPEGTLPDLQTTEYSVQWLKDWAAKGTDQPFFLAMGFRKPHQPLRYPAKYLDLYPMSKISLAPNNFFPPYLPPVAWNPYASLRLNEDVMRLNVSWPYGPIPTDFQLKMRQSYSAATSYTDTQLGILLDTLDREGFADNTIISLIGDHGWSLGEHEEWCKFSNFDIAVRIPMIIHVPGVTSPKAPPGKTFPFIDPLEQTGRSGNANTDKSDQSHHSHTQEQGTKCDGGGDCRSAGGYVTQALVEAVDLFPTLSELAGLTVPPTCPPDDAQVALCSQGSSLVPLIKNLTEPSYNMTLAWKQAVFSQYDRPSYFPQQDSDGPRWFNVKIMGYSMRTAHHRYTEWVAYDVDTFTADWTKLYARELYLHEQDPEENWNMAEVTSQQDLVTQLSGQLRAGWRAALPKEL
ncbi:iduronate 2-sulfatase-like [Littorina saxatilis]|uniref:Sulfatase N-terminal domain-containing protein n=1 Tax=Littorina saxatilis TaxID=31220 RepID=A0AAN9B0I3_9CAEN